MKEEFPWATFCVVVLTFIVAAVGGAVVIWGEPGALSFAEYARLLARFAIALGVLSIGRGIRHTARR